MMGISKGKEAANTKQIFDTMVPENFFKLLANTKPQFRSSENSNQDKDKNKQ